MIKIQTIEYPGKKEIFNNFDKYKQIFLDDGIIPFRNAHCDREEQDEIMRFFGDRLGWWPNNSNSTGDHTYEETHERHMGVENIEDKNALMLAWHLEHVQLKKDIYVGASWCMNLFKCDPDAGVTYFVNMLKFYRELPEEEKSFLSKIEIELPQDLSQAYEAPNKEERTYKLVQNHWLHNEDTIRIFLGSEDAKLYRFDGHTPTKEQEERLKEFLNKLFVFIYENEESRLVHYWQEGDMLISDMFIMAHAVTGGFKQGERRLDGMFATLP